MQKKKTPILAIIGPTAVGKTALSLDVARALNAEIISVDSRQVYKYMDVGTDKISKEIQKEIPHHLIDVVLPYQIFTVTDFVEHAQTAIAQITAKGKTPLFVGGTPFYYQAMFTDVINIDVPTNPEIRDNLLKLSPEDLHNQLSLADPQSASRLHPNDVFRVSRAMEIYLITGKTASELYQSTPRTENPWNVQYIGLIRPRDTLLPVIEKRVRQQFSSGYPEEVKWLLDQGYSPDLPSMQGFGYKELVLYHHGKITLEEAIIGDIIATRQFAKRQMTWFKKFPDVHWIDLSQENYQNALEKITQKCLNHMGG